MDNARCRQLADAVPQLLWVADGDGTCQYLNARAAQYRQDPASGSGEDWTALLHPADREHSVARWREALAAAAPFECHHRMQMADGTCHWHLTRAEPTLDADGRPTAWYGSATDIHAQQLAESRLSALADRMSQLAWMADENGSVYWYNRRWMEYTGKRPEEMLGLGWRSVYHPDHLDRLVEVVSRSIATDEPFEGTFPLRGRDGNYRWFLFRAMPVRDDDGTTHWFGTATDVDRQVVAEQALRDADRRKDEFLSVLAHELRNPLAPIRNSLHIVGIPAAPAPMRQRALEIAGRQVGHLVRLVDDLLDVARIVRGRMQLHMQDEDLAAVVQQAVDDFEAGRDGDRPLLAVRLPEKPVPVHCDRTRMVQVLGNLLTNATRFTPPDGTVEVALDGTTTHAEITVTDTGAGIDAALQAQLFVPFSQARQQLARQQGGLGLGLSLVRGIVELHGGTASIASEGPGKGTQVRVRLPVSQGAAAPADAPAQAMDTRTLRVLIIEDNPDGAESLGALLGLLGHHAESASDGAAGLAALHRQPRDAVICDIGLPGAMDGYAVARAIRSDPQFADLLLIALSGYGQASDVARALEAGFDLHLTKPAQVASLQAALAGAPHAA